MGYLNTCRFNFDGQSSAMLNLVMCWDSANPEVETGLGREIVKGEVNMVRRRANQYGVKYTEVIPIEFMVMHPDGSEFTQIESRTINKWLQRDTYCTLWFDNDEGSSVYYKVICTAIQDRLYNGHVAKMVTFECDSPFAYEKKEFDYECDGTFTTHVYNSSDDGYLYPVLTLNSSSKNFSITNISDNYSEMVLTIDSSYLNQDITIDTNLMMILDEDGTPIPFYKLGWDLTAVDNSEDIQSNTFYWLRLLGKINTLKIKGYGTLKIECEFPRKAGVL